jgi:ABC-2 type transport system permease protein
MNMSLLAFETYFSFKQRTLIFFLIVAIVYGFLIHAQEIGEGMTLIAVNSPYRISYFLILTSVLMPFVIAALCINSLLKDKEHQMEEIIGTLNQKHLLMSRFGHLFISSLTITLCLIIGMLIATLIGDIPPSRLQQQSVFSYFWPWLIMVAPNILLISACLIVTTLKWQNAKLTYAASLMLVICFWISILAINAPITGPTMIANTDWTMLFAIFEPFGSSAFFEQTQYWTPQQKNQLAISLEDNLLLNRVWVLAISVLLFKMICSHSSKCAIPAIAIGKKTQRKTLQCHTSTLSSSANNNNLSVNTDTTSQTSNWKSLKHVIGFELHQLLSNWPMRVLISLWMVLVTIGILMVAGTFSSAESFSGKYPTSVYLVGHAGEAFSSFALIILVYFVAESVWRERDCKVSPLTYAAPIRSLTMYIGKVVSISFLPMIMMSILIAFCLCYQWIADYQRIDYGYYMFSLYFMVTPIILQIILLFFVNTLIANTTNANKYFGMVTSGLLLVFIKQYFSQLDLQSPLLHINQLPDFIRGYSELTGFGQKAQLFNWLLGYWSLFAGLIMIFTANFWLKKERTRDQNSRATTYSALTCVLVISFACYALVILKNKPLSNDFASPDLRLQALATYEKSYKQFEQLQVPQFESSNMQIDLYPEQNKVHIKSDNLLVNVHKNAISQVFISTKAPLNTITLEGAELIKQEQLNNINVYLFKFKTAMLANQNRNFSYTLEMQSNLFALDRSLQNNGSYFHQGQFEPLLGYASLIEMSDNHQRKKYGLPEKTSLALTGHFETNKGYGKFINQKRRFQATISTNTSQTMLTSGQLVKQWQQNGRNYFHYKMDTSIYPLVGYFSAEYTVKQTQVSGIPVSIYFHPSHQANVEEILKATSVTLSYMQNHYGAYPYASLRLIEVPKFHPFGGRASAGVVAMNESLFLQNYQDSAAINNVARNTIHEVVHQWFGEKLVPNITKGEKVLTESITKFLEAEILGEMYGKTMQESLMTYNKNRYLSGRSHAAVTDVPLVEAELQAYLNYGKGPLVFAAVKQHLGEAIFRQVLRQFLESHQEGMTATLPELVASFKQLSAKPNLIDKWFYQVGAVL